MRKQHAIKVRVDGITHRVVLAGMSGEDYRTVTSTLLTCLRSRGKGREVIADSFALAVNLSPEANHSDVWHHVIYRTYLTASSSQSWVRTSGEAFELFLCRYYNALLGPHGIELVPLFDRNARRGALLTMGIPPGMGQAKLDISVSAAKSTGEKKIIGGIHAKASLAERISDDAPVSMEMIGRGYWSPLCTLDVKTYPPRDLTNRGELGSHKKPSDKRGYIEREGQFSACYSYNQRTMPSEGETPSGRRIYRLALKKEFDQLCADAIAERDKHTRS